MDPQEFQHIAEQLIKNQSPAHIRTAIGRAYYAMFNFGAEILKGMGLKIPKSPSAHNTVQRYLHNSGDPQVERVGSQLTDLHSKRIKADYRLNRTDIENQKTAQAIVKQTGRMIKTLDACCHGSQRLQIIAAIKKYEKLISGK